MHTLTEFAPAKVNLFLHITGRRADGYHVLDSLVAFAECGDYLAGSDACELSLAVDGPFGANLPQHADNLVWRAARDLAVTTGIEPRAKLTITKHLPVASGIGGGSADAAAALRLLARLWGVSLDAASWRALAMRLGADVPVCLSSLPARVGGVGEVLASAPLLPACGVLLVNPGIAVETAQVFRARSGAFSSRAVLPSGWPDAAAMAQDLAMLGNDLETPARTLCPPIAEVLARLAAQPGCLLARMSGSGATCFGLFADPEAAARAGRELQAPPGWWQWGGAMRVC